MRASDLKYVFFVLWRERADKSCATSEFLCDLVAFLHDDIGLATETVLRRLGFRVMRPGLPLVLDEIEHKVREAAAVAARERGPGQSVAKRDTVGDIR